MYPLKYHPGLEKRWQTFPESRQIIMVANELNRAKNMLAKNDSHEMKQALERAFELIDLTIEHTRQKLRYELLRFREILGAFYVDQKPTIDSIQKLINTLVSINHEAFTMLHP
jgi:hypothetical protein